MYFKSISIFFFYIKNFKAIRNNVAYNIAKTQKEWLREATLSSPSRQMSKAHPPNLKKLMDKNNRLVPNRKRSTSRLYIVTLLI